MAQKGSFWYEHCSFDIWNLWKMAFHSYHIDMIVRRLLFHSFNITQIVGHQMLRTHVCYHKLISNHSSTHSLTHKRLYWQYHIYTLIMCSRKFVCMCAQSTLLYIVVTSHLLIYAWVLFLLYSLLHTAAISSTCACSLKYT
jgi:hypothetical protein